MNLYSKLYVLTPSISWKTSQKKKTGRLVDVIMWILKARISQDVLSVNVSQGNQCSWSLVKNILVIHKGNKLQSGKWKLFVRIPENSVTFYKTFVQMIVPAMAGVSLTILVSALTFGKDPAVELRKVVLLMMRRFVKILKQLRIIRWAPSSFLKHF